MTTRDAVLAALRDAGPDGVSGERLARELGVSRVTVRNHVGALREVGYEIEASPGTGYRLVAAPDLPLPVGGGAAAHAGLLDAPGGRGSDRVHQR